MTFLKYFYKFIIQIIFLIVCILVVIMGLSFTLVATLALIGTFLVFYNNNSTTHQKSDFDSSNGINFKFNRIIKALNTINL